MSAFDETRPAGSKPAVYAELAQMLAGLLAGERDPVANMANAAALLGWGLPDLNWSGFYVLKGDTLVLGPFIGKPACVRIAIGRGVCGTAVAEGTTQLVDDVHAFPGHIACDPASRSELVVPIRQGSRIVGVIDLDSPLPARFDAEDAAGIERIARLVAEASDPIG